MSDKPMWFVRAGKGAAHASEFRNQGFVALGWKEAGPLSPDVTDEELDQALAAAYPDNKENSRNVYAAQIRRYTREVRVGDHVVTYDNADRAYLIGTIESDVVWEDEDLPRRRRVNWTLRVDRDSLSEDARNKLGSIATFFKVGPEARGELVQNAQPLFGDASPAGPVVGQRARGLVFEDFDVLRRNPVSASWPTLPDADRVSIKQLRQALLSYAVKLSDELQSAVPLKPFASHPNPSGRNAQHYWSCVYPQTVANKSFSFQLFVIVTSGVVEIGFGAGSGSAEMSNTSALAELKQQFGSQREWLRTFRDASWLVDLSRRATDAGFRLRSKWLRDSQSGDVPDIASWVDLAASDEGGGAAISLFLKPAEAIEMGDRLAGWIVERLSVFVPLVDALYAGIISANEPLPKRLAQPALTLQWLEEETLWTRAELERVLDALTGPTPQVILAGPPGTSKTWVAQLLARYLTQDRFAQYRVVQFHPSYSYEEFIEGLRPVATGGAISFEVRNGTVLQMAAGLKPDSDYRVLIIDEMNRANVPRVFGELLYLLEYRERSIDLQYSSGFKLPRKLLFVGTMNTADRSIRSIDVALRRRFDIFECPPNPDLLERYYSSRSNEVPSLVEGFRALNAALTQQLDRHHTIGHSFFMVDPMTPARLAHIWRHKIEPLIEEYFFDQPDTAAEFRISKFWPEAASAS